MCSSFLTLFVLLVPFFFGHDEGSMEDAHDLFGYEGFLVQSRFGGVFGTEGGEVVDDVVEFDGVSVKHCPSTEELEMGGGGRGCVGDDVFLMKREFPDGESKVFSVKTGVEKGVARVDKHGLDTWVETPVEIHNTGIGGEGSGVHKEKDDVGLIELVDVVADKGNVEPVVGTVASKHDVVGGDAELGAKVVGDVVEDTDHGWHDGTGRAMQMIDGGSNDGVDVAVGSV